MIGIRNPKKQAVIAMVAVATFASLVFRSSKSKPRKRPRLTWIAHFLSADLPPLIALCFWAFQRIFFSLGCFVEM
jgi:hypothetical protein